MIDTCTKCICFVNFQSKMTYFSLAKYQNAIANQTVVQELDGVGEKTRDKTFSSCMKIFGAPSYANLNQIVKSVH